MGSIFFFRNLSARDLSEFSAVLSWINNVSSNVDESRLFYLMKLCIMCVLYCLFFFIYNVSKKLVHSSY